MKSNNPEKKKGRKEKFEEAKKIVPVYYTEKEKNYLLLKAHQSGYKYLSKFIHTLSLKNVEKLRPVSPQVVSLSGNLKHIGANINQIARALNKANMGLIPVTETDILEFKNMLSEAIETINSILNHLEND